MITKNDIEKLIAENLSDQATKHADSGWIAATLNTNVVAAPSAYNKYRLIGNILYISMVLSINEAVSTDKTLFTLPEGYRPARTQTFPCAIANSTTVRRIQFSPVDGTVKFSANGTPTASGITIYLCFNFPID